VLAGRLARNTWRHPVLVSLNWVATLAVALGLGAVYWQVTRETGGIQNRRAFSPYDSCHDFRSWQ